MKKSDRFKYTFIFSNKSIDLKKVKDIKELKNIMSDGIIIRNFWIRKKYAYEYIYKIDDMLGVVKIYKNNSIIEDYVLPIDYEEQKKAIMKMYNLKEI